ncbi:hypothetical protein [Terrimonas ferruginea]|uniref:hypothetical protein n=1 Tax=Terrimonas ferruginea TaxID=249 RepID=UPI0004044644|nr:hypothetical protein [Terrimonas ferruginea]
MLDQIAQLVKQYGEGAVVANTDVPNDQNNAVMAEATKTVTSGLQNVMAGGGLQNILDMFKGNSQDGQGGGGIAGLLKNPMVTMMIGHFISKLTTKFNMSPAQASNVANQLIPNVVNDMVTKTASTESADSAFNIDDLVGSLTGGKNFNLQGMLEQFTGGGNSSSGGQGGGFDLQDIISQVTQGAQEKKSEKATEGGGGGIADMIQSFFGK